MPHRRGASFFAARSRAPSPSPADAVLLRKGPGPTASTRRHAFVTLIGITLVLCGCDTNFPSAERVEVTRYAKGAPTGKDPLPVSKVSELNRWLRDHRTGWRKSYVSYVPSLTALGSTASGEPLFHLNIVANRLVLYGEFGQFERELGGSEQEELALILGSR